MLPETFLAPNNAPFPVNDMPPKKGSDEAGSGALRRALRLALTDPFRLSDAQAEILAYMLQQNRPYNHGVALSSRLDFRNVYLPANHPQRTYAPTCTTSLARRWCKRC